MVQNIGISFSFLIVATNISGFNLICLEWSYKTMSRAKELRRDFFNFLNKYKIALGAGIPAAIALAVGVTFLLTSAENTTQLGWAKLWNASRKHQMGILVKTEDKTAATAAAVAEFNDVINNVNSSSVNPWALHQLGNTYYKAGNRDEALNAYNRFIKSYSGHYLAPFVIQSKGYIYEEKGEYQKAVDMFKSMKSEVLQAQNNLDIGRCYEKLGMNQPAIEAYSKVLEYEADAGNNWVELARYRIEELK